MADGIHYPPGGGGASGPQTIGGSTTTSITAGSTNNFVTSSSTNENNTRHIAAKGGTFSDLHVIQTVAPGAGESVVYTLRVNAVDTGVTCTISGTDTTCSDLVNTGAIVAGQPYVLRAVVSAGAATTQAAWGIQLE